MNNIMDFIMNALPWIAIAFFVAISAVRANAAREGKEVGKLFNAISWSPAIVFMLLAIWDMSDGNTSRGTTWLVLGIVNFLLNYMNSGEDDNKETQK